MESTFRKIKLSSSFPWFLFHVPNWITKQLHARAWSCTSFHGGNNPFCECKMAIFWTRNQWQLNIASSELSGVVPFVPLLQNCVPDIHLYFFGCWIFLLNWIRFWFWSNGWFQDHVMVYDSFNSGKLWFEHTLVPPDFEISDSNFHSGFKGSRNFLHWGKKCFDLKTTFNKRAIAISCYQYSNYGKRSCSLKIHKFI